MENLSPKQEMQMLLMQCLDQQAYEAAAEGLKTYEQTFGKDAFSESCSALFPQDGPQVSLICLNVPDEMIDEYLSRQNYINLEIVRTTTSDSYSDIIDYLQQTQSKYICFWEPDYSCSSNKISEMVSYMENQSEANVCVCQRNFMDHSGAIVSNPDSLYLNALKDTLFNGKTFLEYSIKKKHNLYGTLSSIMVRADHAKTLPLKVPSYPSDVVNRISILYQFVLSGTIGVMDQTLVTFLLKEQSRDADAAEPYKTYIRSLVEQNQLTLPCDWDKEPSVTPPVSVAKEITFFYTDKGEYYNLLPIADEAQKRGYTIHFTEDVHQAAEIGIYCQHVCFPENAKFSLILLHDMAQGHNRWPNIWEKERWDQFDIGILPGKLWADLWSQCAFQYYANPRLGTYELGYPKSDIVGSASLKMRADELRQSFSLPYDFSVLYAPSWENDEKEDDFVRALASLKVNLLIKQAHWPREYRHIIDNIKNMRSLHEGKYENVFYIEPQESILTALELCDAVVSDESSVMAEAVMFGKPSIAVTDWLIPDTSPSRFASVPMDYVLKCKKVELREHVEKLASHSSCYDSVLQKGKLLFSNQGNCCKNILDAIDYYTGESTDCSFLNRRISSKYTANTLWS